MPDPTTAAAYRALVDALQAHGRRGVTTAELAEQLGQPLGVVSTRLQALSRRGLVRTLGRGRVVYWPESSTAPPTPAQLAALKQLAQGGQR